MGQGTSGGKHLGRVSRLARISSVLSVVRETGAFTLAYLEIVVAWACSEFMC